MTERDLKLNERMLVRQVIPALAGGRNRPLRMQLLCQSVMLRRIREEQTMRLFAVAVASAAISFSALAQENKQENKTVTIAVSGPPAQLYFLPVVLAKQLGHFEQAGVNVELQHFNAGSRALESVIGGSADMVAGAYENTVRMQAKGQLMQSVVLFGRYPQNVLGIVKTQAGTFKSPANLKGQRIGITGPGSASHTFLNLILASAGLKPEDVTPVTVGAGAVAIAAMKRASELYAISNLDLAITELVMSGDIVATIDSRNAEGTRAVYGGDYASGSLYAPAAFVQRNPKSIEAIAISMVRTLAWMAKASPDEIVAKLPADFYQGNLAVYRKALESNLPSFSPDGLMPNGAPGNVLKAMARFDPAIASAKIDMATTYDNRFVQAALRTVK
jgi:NitT/TauT family transport system substrate-binding protein